jgi:hypothetical protein
MYSLYLEETLVIKQKMVHRTYEPRKQLKAKAIPLQVWTGPEGCRRLRLPDFKTIGT